MWEHFPPDVKKALLGKMVYNDLAERSFAGVTEQFQCYSWIYMCSADVVSDTAKNGFLDRPTTRNQMERHQQGLFHVLPDEFQITLVMVDMEDAPENRKSNNNDLNWQLNMRHMKSELTWEKEFKHVKDEFIDALIYHRMCSSDVLWKIIAAVTEGLKILSTIKTSLGR